MSRAERLTHYSDLMLNFGTRFDHTETHAQKHALAKELLRALRWQMKHNKV